MISIKARAHLRRLVLERMRITTLCNSTAARLHMSHANHHLDVPYSCYPYCPLLMVGQADVSESSNQLDSLCLLSNTKFGILTYSPGSPHCSALPGLMRASSQCLYHKIVRRVPLQAFMPNISAVRDWQNRGNQLKRKATHS